MDIFIFIVFCIEIPVNSVDPNQMPHFAESELDCNVCILPQNGYLV